MAASDESAVYRVEQQTKPFSEKVRVIIKTIKVAILTQMVCLIIGY